MGEKNMSENIPNGGQTDEYDTSPKGLLRKALELLESDEKSAADREAKLQVLRLIASLRSGQADDYVKGYKDGFAQGFKEGFVAAWRKLDLVPRGWLNDS